MEHPRSLPATVAQLLITDQLQTRAARAPDYLREKLAIQDLAQVMAEQPADILPRLIRLAMEICEADSAGVSVLDSDAGVFRWVGLAGALSVFEGATTPRDFSPCGICLDLENAILMANPERVYDWVRDAGIVVPEVLLVPLFVGRTQPLGTLWVVAREGQHFDGGHARTLSEMATFTGLALSMVQTKDKLAKALVEQELLTREMSHRVKNVFAVADGLIRASARHAVGKDDMVEALSGRMRAFREAHALVQRSTGQVDRDGGGLAPLLTRILSPYGDAATFAGPDIRLGEKATTDLALVFHELATNAFKYGALGQANGTVTVRWRIDGDRLGIDWEEFGQGPAAPPTNKGFGSTLIAAAMAGQQAEIHYDWRADGLRVRMAAALDKIGR